MVFALPGQRGRGPSLAKKCGFVKKNTNQQDSYGKIVPKAEFLGNMTYAYEVEEEHGSINYD